jgi:hypothetical protein
MVVDKRDLGLVPVRSQVKYFARSIVYMANWKVIETVSDNIEAVSGPAAQDRPEPASGLSGKGKPLTKLKPCGGLMWHSSSIRIVFGRRRRRTPTH